MTWWRRASLSGAGTRQEGTCSWAWGASTSPGSCPTRGQSKLPVKPHAWCFIVEPELMAPHCSFPSTAQDIRLSRMESALWCSTAQFSQGSIPATLGSRPAVSAALTNLGLTICFRVLTAPPTQLDKVTSTSLALPGSSGAVRLPHPKFWPGPPHQDKKWE